MGISDLIASFLQESLNEADGGVLEVQRSDLAQRFNCVPSQINYVMSTRFSPEHGYIVESRRGGGGYLRIIRLSMEEEGNLSALLEQARGKAVSRQSGLKLVERLREEEFLSRREAMLVDALTDSLVLKTGPEPDLLRGALLNSMLLLLLRDDFTNEA